MHCTLCNRELASAPDEGADPICVMCGEQILRIMHALMRRGKMSILSFIGAAMMKKQSVTTDDEFVAALNDYAEWLIGHIIPCDKCNLRRWAKDL